MKATGHLARCSHRWKALNVAKALKGMVAHELVDGHEVAHELVDGHEVAHELVDGHEVPFEPQVIYDERHEPFPWVVR